MTHLEIGRFSSKEITFIGLYLLDDVVGGSLLLRHLLAPQKFALLA